MLFVLHIENIAVIEAAEIEFGMGYNVLTGETGAGKSIVVDAIGAVMGGRTSRDLIRTGAKAARVEAVFHNVPSLTWFEENGMEPDEDGNLILQREIQLDGKNTCRVNGRAVTVSQLRGLGSGLLDIHGQHDGQRLLDERSHLAYLDSFGGLGGLIEAYQKSYRKLRDMRQEMDALQMDESEKARKIDSLRFQIAELERADLKPGEDAQLLEKREVLANAGKLIEHMEDAHHALSGDDDLDGAAALLMKAERALSAGGTVSSELAALSRQLAELRCSAQDLADQVRDIRFRFDFEPGELDELEARLDVIYRLRKKYGDTVEEMLDYLERCRAELDQIAVAGDTLERLEQKYQGALEEARKKGAVLTKAREEAGVRLDQRIEKELKQLDMPKVCFQTQLRPKQGQDPMDETGMDEVQFLMSANVGEALKSIQKIASGGELARIMLALKNVLAENETVTTLIFDEVDTGVSGRAAQKVAEKMADVARSKQVLCVTHLPQIAAMADIHFSVQKGERNGRTYTAVEQLAREQRQEELARLSAGAHITAAAMESAGELLDAAEQYKTKAGRGTPGK